MGFKMRLARILPMGFIRSMARTYFMGFTLCAARTLSLGSNDPPGSHNWLGFQYLAWLAPITWISHLPWLAPFGWVSAECWLAHIFWVSDGHWLSPSLGFISILASHPNHGFHTSDGSSHHISGFQSDAGSHLWFKVVLAAPFPGTRAVTVLAPCPGRGTPAGVCTVRAP